MLLKVFTRADHCVFSQLSPKIASVRDKHRSETVKEWLNLGGFRTKNRCSFRMVCSFRRSAVGDIKSPFWNWNRKQVKTGTHLGQEKSIRKREGFQSHTRMRIYVLFTLLRKSIPPNAGQTIEQRWIPYPSLRTLRIHVYTTATPSTTPKEKCVSISLWNFSFTSIQCVRRY